MEFVKTKTCNRCEVEKPASEYHKDRGKPDGLYGICKPCRKDLSTLSRPSFKKCTGCSETKPADAFHRSAKDADGLKSRCKACRAGEKRDYEREKARSRYYANRTEMLRKNTKYREANRERLNEYSRLWSRTIKGKAKKLVRAAAARARSGGLAYDLDWEWLYERLLAGKCEATGIELHVTEHVGDVPWAPSIDRIVPSRGYTKENCRVVCYMMNMAKNGFSDDDVEVFCRAFLEHRCTKKTKAKAESILPISA